MGIIFAKETMGPSLTSAPDASRKFASKIIKKSLNVYKNPRSWAIHMKFGMVVGADQKKFLKSWLLPKLEFFENLKFRFL
jgi:hypothetical protein